MELFTQDGALILSRWVHVMSGVTWIGILYYFNFVQVPAFAEFDAGARTEAVRKLATRALWWFRWGAVLTLLSGLTMIGLYAKERSDIEGAPNYLSGPTGTAILTGAILGLIMFLNVWLVIWPNQKIVIASAEGVAAGKEPDSAAAAAGRKGLMASRQNTIFSIPMLWFMVASAHFAGVYGKVATEGTMTYWIVVLVIVALLELSALGVIGGTAPAGVNAVYDTHKTAIITGFVLWAVFALGWEVMFG